MAWSWSHTSEAYAAAEHNLRQLDTDTIRIIYAEWRAAQGKHGVIDSCFPEFSERKYNRALKYAASLNDEQLADFIWQRAEESATCDNGGFDAWMCPHGCHCVPFDTADELEHAGE